MAKRGERKSQKRLSASRAVRIDRKEFNWILRAKPGPHSREFCVPLGVVVRDWLGIASNLREAKLVLSRGEVLVNGVARKAVKFAVGLFDVVSLPLWKKSFRVVLDANGRLELKAIPEREKRLKLCRIVGKRAVKGNLIQIETDDGRVFVGKKSSLKLGDSVVVSLPEQKVLRELKLEEGALAYLVGGEHAGEIARVKGVVPGTMKRTKLVSLEGKKGGFLTVAGHVFVVGVKKPEISLRVNSVE